MLRHGGLDAITGRGRDRCGTMLGARLDMQLRALSRHGEPDSQDAAPGRVHTKGSGASRKAKRSR
jgi:hypothetical protein